MIRWMLAGVALVAISTACSSKASVEEVVAKGNEYFAQDKIAEAIVQYRLAIQADPNRGDVRLKLAEAYLRRREGSAALRESVAAADLMPEDGAAQLGAGNLLLVAGAFEDAKTRAEKALALNPKNVEALILMGNALAGLQDLDGAIAEYQEALALNPTQDQAYTNLGSIQFSRGQIKEAEATFRKAVENAPKAVSVHMALASFLWASGRAAEAEASLRKALELEPANLLANRALGVFLMSTGRADAAEQYFKTIAQTAATDEAQLSLADYYLVMRRVDEARAILGPLGQKTATFAAASLRLAAVEAGQNNRDGAREILNGVLDRMPKYAPARIVNVRMMLAEGKIDEALESARAMVRDDPSGLATGEAHFIIGSIEASRDRTEEALQSLTEALRIQPRAVAVLSALAQLHVRLGNADRAETYARQVLSQRPQDYTARVLLVRADLIRNDTLKSAAGLANLEKDLAGNPAVMNLSALHLRATGRPEAARAKYLEVLKQAPADLEALQGLIVLDLQAGRAKEASERAESALKAIGPSADLYVLVARAQASAGNPHRAEELLQLAIDRDPARLEAYGLLGRFYVQQNRLVEATDQYRRLLEKNPRSVSVNTVLGMILEARGDLPAAEQQYQQTLTIDPTAAVASNNLAWIYVSANRNLDQALQLAQTALRSLPEDPHVNDTLGWVYYRKALFPLAVRHLELSVARNPKDPVSQYHLGMAYSRAGTTGKAREALTSALALSPSFDGVHEARSTLAVLPTGKNEP